MNGPNVILASFPNPVDWIVDNATGLVGGAADAGLQGILGGIVRWVVDAAISVSGTVFGYFTDATEPNVQADWFVSGTGPFRTTATIAATLLVLFVFIGIVQGVIAGDVGGMLRRISVDLPLSVLGMVGVVTITQALINLTDVLSGYVLRSFEDETRTFLDAIATVGSQHDPGTTAFVLVLLGLAAALGGIILVAELAIREALIYIVVALAPLALATLLWPAMKGISRKLLELLCALILSKLVIAIALGVASAAAVGIGTAGSTTSIPTPESVAETPAGSTNQAVGLLLAAAVTFGVAAFSPMIIARLLPLTEGAIVAQGVRGGPIRAGHQGMMMANTAQMVTGRRFGQLAAGKAGGSGAAAGSGGGGAVGAGGAGGGSAAAGGASAGSAAAGPVAVAAAATVGSAKAAKGAASTGARAATSTAEAATSPSPADRPTPARRTPDRGSSPPPRHESPEAASPPKHPGPSKGATGGS